MFGFEPHPIFWGKQNSKIVQISQAPSSNVYKSLKPFTDMSGRTLKYDWYQISDDEFYNIDNFYIGALAHCYPGKDKNGNEKIFRLIKFRTMSNEKDENGNLLPDEKRLGSYGKFLRSTSLDELPSLINIIIGDLSLVGPRPQLVRDMTFMSPEQRRRHDVRPGLTGLAQINGRNNITWEQKFEYDLKYIDDGITLVGDIKILFKTVFKVVKRSDTVREGTVSDLDFGDWLMLHGKITESEYNEKQAEAKELLKL